MSYPIGSILEYYSEFRGTTERVEVTAIDPSSHFSIRVRHLDGPRKGDENGIAPSAKLKLISKPGHEFMLAVGADEVFGPEIMSALERTYKHGVEAGRKKGYAEGVKAAMDAVGAVPIPS